MRCNKSSRYEAPDGRRLAVTRDISNISTGSLANYELTLNESVKFVIEAKEGSLLARAIQHEFDHLDGVLFIDEAYTFLQAFHKHSLSFLSFPASLYLISFERILLRKRIFSGVISSTKGISLAFISS